MLPGSFMASKISHSASCGVCSGVLLSEGQEWCRQCQLMFGH